MLLGASRPLRSLASNEFNSKGYFEPAELVATHDEILRTAGKTWASCGPVRSADWSRDERLILARRIVQVLLSSFEEFRFACVKDPRIAVLGPIWVEVLEILEARTVFLIPLREPENVAASLLRRNDMPSPVGLLLWLRYMIEVERWTRNQERAFIPTAKLIEAPLATLDAISSRFGFEWPLRDEDAALSRFLEHRLLSDRRLPQTPILNLAGKAYRQFLELSEDPDNRDALREIGELAATVDIASDAVDQALAKRTDILMAEQRRLEENLAWIESTLSWRLTAPLRTAASTRVGRFVTTKLK